MLFLHLPKLYITHKCVGMCIKQEAQTTKNSSAKHEKPPFKLLVRVVKETVVKRL